MPTPPPTRPRAGDAPAVAAEVRALLAADVAEGSVLDEAPGALLDGLARGAAPLAEPVPTTPADRLAGGSRVGPYVLARPVGRGGMGTVWTAHPADAGDPPPADAVAFAGASLLRARSAFGVIAAVAGAVAASLLVATGLLLLDTVQLLALVPPQGALGVELGALKAVGLFVGCAAALAALARLALRARRTLAVEVAAAAAERW